MTATAYLTGIPVAVGAKMLAEEKIKKRGVFPPEALEPEPFLEEVRQKDIVTYEKTTVSKSFNR